MKQYEKFYDEIKSVNGTLRVTIPHKLVKYAGYEEGDEVIVMIRKKRKDEN